jgi:hypothetical protein
MYSTSSNDDADLFVNAFSLRRGADQRLSLKKRATNQGKSLFMSLRGRSKSSEKTLQLDMPGQLKHMHKGRLPNLDDDDKIRDLNNMTGRKSSIPITFGSNVMSTAVQMRKGSEANGDLRAEHQKSMSLAAQAEQLQRDSQISCESEASGLVPSEGGSGGKESTSVVSEVDDLSQLSSIEKDSVLSLPLPINGEHKTAAEIHADGFSTTSADRESTSTNTTVTPTERRKDVDSSDTYMAADIWVKVSAMIRQTLNG